MSRPDAALALAAVYAGGTKGLLRVCAVCVAGGGLGTAIFCDVVNRFYVPAARSSNSTLPIGLAAVDPLPPDGQMVKAAIDRKKPDGDLQYIRSIRTLTDTAQAEAVLRNGVTLTPRSVVVLSAPATWLARALDLAGVKALYRERVKALVIVEAGVTGHDAPALRRLLAEWPTPVVFCPRDVGDALLFPGAELEQHFTWAPAHPVVDAYRAYHAMPYDSPLHDLAAMHYALKPDGGLFTLSDAGVLSVAADGKVAFAAGSGSARKLVSDPSKHAEAVAALVALATAAPAPPAGRGRL